MMLAVVPFPNIDPVALAIGPLAIRWYALAYMAGLTLGLLWAKSLARQRPWDRPTADDLDEFLVWAVCGVVLGGRLGSVLFYQPAYYLQNPLEIFAVWKGGMSFHGGMLGVLVAVFLFGRRRKFDPLKLGDIVAVVAPVGLFFGRIANFINGELWGRPTDVAWAMVFPHADGQPRHPSQLYQACLEGLVLLVVMQIAVRRPALRERPGALAGIFLIGYGIARIIGEFFRQPDVQLGFLVGGITMGQLLSLPMLLAGAWLVRRALQRPASLPPAAVTAP
jgi:phosphatidylglycerol:prolipoprotein diacylglycerol transferase